MQKNVFIINAVIIGILTILALVVWCRPFTRPTLPLPAPKAPGHGIWLSHGWLGHDDWFIKYGKEKDKSRYRDQEAIRELAATLHHHGITDLFPHLGPATPEGHIPPVDQQQAARFLSTLEKKGFRIMPWVGGIMGKQVFINDPSWRRNFTDSIRRLLREYPDLAGIHLNIEPWPSGSTQLLALLDETRRALPQGKILSVAAYPPPTIWQTSTAIHWEKEYYAEVAARADQLAVMLYDTGLETGWLYRLLLASWTREVLSWSAPSSVLLGLPAYDDAGVGYHDPQVENLGQALAGVCLGLQTLRQMPPSYQGIAIYAHWEMDNQKWKLFNQASKVKP